MNTVRIQFPKSGYQRAITAQPLSSNTCTGWLIHKFRVLSLYTSSVHVYLAEFLVNQVKPWAEHLNLHVSFINCNRSTEAQWPRCRVPDFFIHVDIKCLPCINTLVSKKRNTISAHTVLYMPLKPHCTTQWCCDWMTLDLHLTDHTGHTFWV